MGEGVTSARNDAYAATVVDSINDLCKRAIAEYAYEDVAAIVDERHAELVSIGARIRDWRNLNRRIEFLTMVAKQVTFLGILKNEGVTLTLVGEDKFTSEPKNIDPEIRKWIVDNRPAIVAELRGEKR